VARASGTSVRSYHSCPRGDTCRPSIASPTCNHTHSAPSSRHFHPLPTSAQTPEPSSPLALLRHRHRRRERQRARGGGWGPETYRCLASSSFSSAKVPYSSPIDRFLTDLLPLPPVSSFDSLCSVLQTATGGRRRPGSSRPPTSGTSATSRVSPARQPVPPSPFPLAPAS
jgi:hypothetical protein